MGEAAGKVAAPSDGGAGEETGGGAGEETGGGTGDNDVINPFVRIIFKPEYTGYYPSVIAQKSEGYDYFIVNGVDIKDSISDSIAGNSGVTIMASSGGSITYNTTSASPVEVELKFSDEIDRSLYINLLEGVATIGSDRTMSFVLRAAP